MKTCSRCKKEHEDAGALCDGCAAFYKNYQKARRVRRALEKVCWRCPQRVLPGKTHCAVHDARIARDRHDVREARKAQGRCPDCGVPVDPLKGLVGCEGCRARDSVSKNKGSGRV